MSHRGRGAWLRGGCLNCGGLNCGLNCDFMGFRGLGVIRVAGVEVGSAAGTARQELRGRLLVVDEGAACVYGEDVGIVDSG